MKQDTVYNILKNSFNPQQAEAVSKIFDIQEEARGEVVEQMTKAGLHPDSAEGLVKVFLDFAK